MYTVDFTAKAKKQTAKLPLAIQKKLKKQLLILIKDFRYPSLHTKRVQGLNRWESRIDYHYRFSFEIKNTTVIILSIGPHDEGLGKK